MLLDEVDVRDDKDREQGRQQCQVAGVQSREYGHTARKCGREPYAQQPQ